MRFLLFGLALLIFGTSKAQEIPDKAAEKKKEKTESGSINPGMKAVPRGRSLQAPPRETPVSSASPSSRNQPVAPATWQAYAGTSKQPVAEPTVLYNYNKLSPDVKRRLDANKAAGRSTMDGICRRFEIMMPGIQTIGELQTKLSRVTSSKGVSGAGLIAPGRIYILASPSLPSEKLKELLSSQNLDFDFQKEEFRLIQ